MPTAGCGRAQRRSCGTTHFVPERFIVAQLTNAADELVGVAVGNHESGPVLGAQEEHVEVRRRAEFELGPESARVTACLLQERE